MSTIQTAMNASNVLQMTEVTDIELHISAHWDAFAKWSKKIKAAGGDFSHARGHQTTRIVHLPLASGLVPSFIAAYLADSEHMRKHGMSVLFRGGMYTHSWCIVQRTKVGFDDAVAQYLNSCISAIDRGYDGTPEQKVAARAEYEAQRVAAKAKADDTAIMTMSVKDQTYEIDPKIDAEVRAVLWANVTVEG